MVACWTLLTLWVPPMQDSEGNGVMKLMLGGNNDGVEEPPASSIVQCIGQRDRGAEVDNVYYNP